MNKNPASERLIGSVSKASDLECHIRVVTVENVRRGVEMTLRILERFAAMRPVMEED